MDRPARLTRRRGVHLRMCGIVLAGAELARGEQAGRSHGVGKRHCGSVTPKPTPTKVTMNMCGTLDLGAEAEERAPVAHVERPP